MAARTLLRPVLVACMLAAEPAFAQGVPSKVDKCPVCGMFVAKYPDWIGALRFTTGNPVYADGAKDLMRCLQDLPRFVPGRRAADVVAIDLKDYYSLAWIDARKAFFVIGSDVFGPMGKELVPFAGEEDARAFLREHKGQRVVRFDEITPALLRSLE